VLVGNSLGSQVAAQAAVDHPDHVLGLVLTGPTFDPSEPSLAAHALRVLRDIPHERPSIWFLHVPDWILAGPRRAIGTLRHAWAHRIERVLPDVRVPTVVVRGEHDALAPRRWVREAAGLLPIGRALEVRGSSHAVNHRSPKAVARIVAELADSVAAVGRSQLDGTMPIHIVTATHRRRPVARPRRGRAGPPRS
jgi:pimeloyl-ACP methyl ester carboxylesterase